MEGRDDSATQYALKGKIMLTTIIVLFAVVLFMVALHLYARWYLLRARRRQIERRRQRRTNRSHQALGIHVLPVAHRGLDVAVLNSLPVFLHSSEVPKAECAVCLSEFEDKETLRLLPKCSHTFHIECIDMWFHSHSTCPLCRSPVEKVERNSGKSPEILNSLESVNIHSPPPPPPPPPLGDRRKVLELAGVRVDVPIRVPPETESSHHSSPASRFLNRILSMGRKSPGSTTPVRVRGELDLESGPSELNRGESASEEATAQFRSN